MSYTMVKRIWQSYQQSGSAGLNLQYGNCGYKHPKYYFVLFI